MYFIYLEYLGNNELVAKVNSYYRAKKMCNKLTNENYIGWYKKQQLKLY
jgi:hypothetical protein